MPRGRPRKEVPTTETITQPVVATPIQTERETLLTRQARLLELRDAMTSEGIHDISKLDALLSQVNSRLAQI